MNITETELTWHSHPDCELKAILYRPDDNARQSNASGRLAIDVHGGAWSMGDRHSGAHYNRRLADAGITVFAIDFRQGPAHKHPAAVEDIHLAIDWCRKHLPHTSLGLIGSSSGGHLALDAAINPPASGGVEYVIALWPVSNPIARYEYAIARLHEDPATFVRFAPDRLKAGHEAYFVDPKQMSQAAIQHQLNAGQFTDLPPVFIVQPELDQNVPVMMSQTLAGAWELAGGDVQYKRYPGVAHAFAHADGPQTDTCIEDMVRFILARTT